MLEVTSRGWSGLTAGIASYRNSNDGHDAREIVACGGVMGMEC